jgi:hypothetical protein
LKASVSIGLFLSGVSDILELRYRCIVELYVLCVTSATASVPCVSHLQSFPSASTLISNQPLCFLPVKDLGLGIIPETVPAKVFLMSRHTGEWSTRSILVNLLFGSVNQEHSISIYRRYYTYQKTNTSQSTMCAYANYIKSCK